MLQIECAVSGCPYGGRIEEREEDDPDLPSNMLEQLHFLRVYLRECEWLSILVGTVEEMKEVWICPICQQLMEKARENPEG